MELLTNGEEETLIMNLAFSRDEAGFTEEEGVRLIQWARDTVTAQALLELALDGKVWVEITPDLEVRFRPDETGALQRALEIAFNES